MPAPRRLVVDGPQGAIECILELPDPADFAAARGLALVCHPHPLYGGTFENKVTSTLARAFLALGWVALRPNFRGVGQSAGVHDDGEGETADMRYLLEHMPGSPELAGILPPSPPVALAGFSFGSFVVARLAAQLAGQGRAATALVLVGAAAGKWAMPPVDPDAILIHGEKDETILLADVMEWARAGGNTIVVVPGADHFFHRRIALVKRLVIRNLAGLDAMAGARAVPVPQEAE
jgi:alpha/beta superfamily hydrolase